MRNGHAIVPAETGVILDLDHTLRALGDDAPPEALTPLVEGIRMAAEIYGLAFLLTPWLTYEMGEMFREIPRRTWRALALGGQLGAELRPARTSERPRLAPGFSGDGEKALALEQFLRTQLGGQPGAAHHSVTWMRRGVIHTLDWRDAPESAAFGRGLAHQARDAGFGALVWDGALAHLLPRDFDRDAMVEEVVSSAGVSTVIAITDTEPGTRVWRRLRQLRNASGSDVRQVICIALGEQLMADAAGLADRAVAEAGQVGTLLMQVARSHTLPAVDPSQDR